MNRPPEVAAELVSETRDGELRPVVCLLMRIRNSQETDRPLSEDAGRVLERAASTNHPDVDVTVRQCAQCAIKITLAEFTDSAPATVAPNGELAFLPSCVELQ